MVARGSSPTVREGVRTPAERLDGRATARSSELSLHPLVDRFSVRIVQLALGKNQFNEIIAHAQDAAPNECCGLIGGASDGAAKTIYRTRNVAANPLVTYEASPQDLFAAQREMRERGEELIAIYHSHPRAGEPEPSATDVRLAYYPSAVYLIVGLGNDEPCVRAFRINERDGWQAIDYQIAD